MSLLGTFIDKKSAVALDGGISTLAHSLGTTPDAVLIQLRSQTAASINPVLAPGANASLATVGATNTSNAVGDVFIIYFQSVIR